MDRNNLELASSYIEVYIDAAARELEMQPPENAAALILAIPLIQAQRLITQILPVYAARILDALADEEAASILSGSNPNQIATILRHLPVRPRGELLKLLPERLSARSRRLLQHPESSVGAWMKIDVLMLPGEITAVDALHRIEESGSLGDGDVIPVLSDSQQPAGFVSFADLLRAGSEILVSRLRREIDPLVISSKMSLRAAESHSGWQLQDNLIVINSRGQVEGILRHRDLRKSLQVAPSRPVPIADDSMLTGLGQAYLGTLGSLFSLINESPAATAGLAQSVQEEPQ